MSDDPADSDSSLEQHATPLERVVERILEGGLPEVIAGPAGKAISRLIGGFADIPAAWFEQKAQAIRDKTVARSQVMKKLSEAVGDRTSLDKDLLERAQQNWLGKAYHRQENREAIAVETIALLSEAPPDAGAADPPEDWMNIFESYAENATSDNLRATWAHVLAREIRQPKSFSLRTLQFIATLDAETAETFERVTAFVAFGSKIYMPSRFNFTPAFQDLLDLREAGLLGGDTNNRLSVIDGSIIVIMKGYAINIPVNGVDFVDLENTPLTTVGVQIYNLLQPPENHKIVVETAALLASQCNSDHAMIYKTDSSGNYFLINGERVSARADP